jgi:hypothetical protein
MDMVFHGSAAVLLAHTLGERRKSCLVAAAVMGMFPDIVWPWIPAQPHSRIMYAWFHSLSINLPISALLLLVNYRIAFGNILHLAVDVVTHQSSTSYLLHPWCHPRAPLGIDWWHGRGLFLWAFLWMIILLLAVCRYRRVINSHSSGGGMIEAS